MAATYMLVSYIILAICAVILMCSEPAEGLTAFGKNPTNDKGSNNNATKPTRKPTSKSCSVDGDCNTNYGVCRLDQREGKKRCRCPDDTPIDNGACKQQGQAPGSSCNDQLKCTKNSECVTNGTRKYCVCYEGYEEMNHRGFVYCNGIERLTPLTLSILYCVTAFGCLRTILQYH